MDPAVFKKCPQGNCIAGPSLLAGSLLIFDLMRDAVRRKRKFADRGSFQRHRKFTSKTKHREPTGDGGYGLQGNGQMFCGAAQELTPSFLSFFLSLAVMSVFVCCQRGRAQDNFKFERAGHVFLRRFCYYSAS